MRSICSVGVLLDSQLHLIPTSSLCRQLWLPTVLCLHFTMLSSLPWHCTLSNQISPVPGPNALVTSRALLNPRLLHKTLASFKSQSSSQTVPHSPLICTSTLPSQAPSPPAKRTGISYAVAIKIQNLLVYGCKPYPYQLDINCYVQQNTSTLRNLYDYSKGYTNLTHQNVSLPHLYCGNSHCYL